MNQHEYKSIELTKHFEGCRLTAYRDVAGVWTIGYGHTKGVKAGQSITQEQADQFLIDDIQPVVDAINKYAKVELSQHQFDALVDFAFNLGINALLKSTLWNLVQNNKFAEANEQFVRWNHAGGKEIPGLTKRRKLESILFCS